MPLMRVRRRRWIVASISAFALASAWLVWLNACAAPLRVEPVLRKCREPVVDGDLELARRYAPWMYHEIDARGGRQDIPAPLDFDGNLDGDDNWENLPRCALVPTVTYAHLETATHHFLAYHVFHPRDWEPFDLGVHMTHEGDGENLAVVVDKTSQRVVLLFTQAHYCGGAYADDDDGFASAERDLRGPFLRTDDFGRPAPDGTHAAVFVGARGHGIYGALGDDSRVRVDADGRARFERNGIVLRPARIGEHVGEPSLDSHGTNEALPYQLESTHAKLWLLLLRGELVGTGRALDRTVHYEDARVAIELPKFHRGDRFSGPLGSSRGISPFALDFGWSAGTLGMLFFDPARRYAECLKVPAAWSLDYVDYPFATR